MHFHPDLDENGNDPRILTNGPMAHGTHSGVDENLRHCIFRSRVLLHLPGAMDSLNKSNLERAALRKQVESNAEWIESINAFRRQVNASITQLEADVAALNAPVMQ